MAYFKDLTPFVYGGEELDENILNVGWLSDSVPFNTGSVDKEFLNKLYELVKNPVSLYRGYHYCEFCPPPVLEPIPNRVTSRVVIDCPHGNGEIRVNYKSKVYVAPVLIHHYVSGHNYLPPIEFINSVLQITPNKLL